jgi:hypothetical protein
MFMVYLLVFRGADAREPMSSSGSDLFENWPETNNVAASVYVALTVEGLSSRASTVDASRGRRKSCAYSSTMQQPHSQAAPS